MTTAIQPIAEAPVKLTGAALLQKHYRMVKKICRYRAFHFRVEESDLVSAVLSTRLSPRERAVFDHIFIEDMKYEEAAKALEMPLGTLKNVLFLIRGKIQQRFGAAYRMILN